MKPTTRIAVIAAVLLSGWAPTASAQRDPGLVLEIDYSRFELTPRDQRSGERGPSIRVALGSPARPTPTGSFPIYWVILNPAWRPGPAARKAGAMTVPPSASSPMGVAKIPFGADGIALHGAGDYRLLGKPVSGGCVRAGDSDLLGVIAWLEGQRALGPPGMQTDGEIHRALLRPTRVVVH